MKSLLQFLKSKTFFINLILAVLLVIGAIWGTFSLLSSYTLHGETITVPDLKGYQVDKVDSITEEHNLRFVIMDSVYVDGEDPGAVITQKPDAEDKVKKGRRIYLTINSLHPEMITMPDLRNLSQRQALSVLEVVGLQLKNVEYQPDVCVGCVLDQKVDGDPIEPGTRIEKNKGISLVLGKGESKEKTPVPDFVGETINQVEKRLTKLVLSKGAVNYDQGCCETAADSANAMVHKQKPDIDEKDPIPLGSEIDLWLTTDEQKVRQAKEGRKALKNDQEEDNEPSN